MIASYMPQIPKFGFGTAFELNRSDEIDASESSTSENERNKLTKQQFKDLLEHAIKMGVRHIDCAPTYRTQELVGQVLKKSFKSIPREEFFIASKIPVNMMRLDKIELSFHRTLQDLQLAYLDLLLIHAPFATKFIKADQVYPMDERGQLIIDDESHVLERAWKKLGELKEQKRVKYIGLSNVNKHQLDRCNHLHKVDVVQNEYHLYNQDRHFFDHCEEVDVHYEAYAAFGCPPKARAMSLPTFETDPIVDRIAKEKNLTYAQVIVQWLHRQPLTYVIRSDNVKQLEENFNATKLPEILTINDMIDLDSLNKNARIYYFDNYRGIARHPEYPFRKKLFKSR